MRADRRIREIQIEAPGRPSLGQQRTRREQQHGLQERVERVGDDVAQARRRSDVVSKAADGDGGVAGLLPGADQAGDHAATVAAVMEQLRRHGEGRDDGGVQHDGHGRGVEELHGQGVPPPPRVPGAYRQQHAAAVEEHREEQDEERGNQATRDAPGVRDLPDDLAAGVGGGEQGEGGRPPQAVAHPQEAVEEGDDGAAGEELERDQRAADRADGPVHPQKHMRGGLH